MSVEVPIQGAVEAAETNVSAAAYASEQPSASVTTGEGMDGQSSLHWGQPALNGDSMHCGDAGSSQSSTMAGRQSITMAGGSASVSTDEDMDGQSSLHWAQPAPNGDSMRCGDAGSSQSTTVAGHQSITIANHSWWFNQRQHWRRHGWPVESPFGVATSPQWRLGALWRRWQ